jgi:hypothetical protein
MKAAAALTAAAEMRKPEHNGAIVIKEFLSDTINDGQG